MVAESAKNLFTPIRGKKREKKKKKKRIKCLRPGGDIRTIELEIDFRRNRKYNPNLEIWDRLLFKRLRRSVNLIIVNYSFRFQSIHSLIFLYSAIF